MSDLLQIAGVPEKNTKPLPEKRPDISPYITLGNVCGQGGMSYANIWCLRPRNHDGHCSYEDGYTPCARPGHNILTHCVEEMDHEGSHTYAPTPEPEDKMSSDLDEVIHTLVHSCPNYMAGDVASPRPLCCPFHKAAWTVGEAQKVLRAMKR